MINKMMKRRWLVFGLGMLTIPAGGAAQARDTIPLSLNAAVAQALERSEEVRLAQSRVSTADAQVASVRAGAFPQINSSLGFTRTFESSFGGGGGGFQTPDSLRFQPLGPDAPLDQRVKYLEDNVGLAALQGLGQAFGNLPFGQEHAYNFGVTGSQLLYSGGRVGAALDVAREYREAARITLTGETAVLALQVRSAYYQALLAGQVESAAAAALTQAREFTEQEQLRLRAGRASELDVLRAQVAEANLRPQLVQARNAADLALLNLKRLVDVPLRQPVRLTTDLAIPSAEALRRVEPSAEFAAAQRARVEAAERQVRIAERGVRIARGSYLPNVALTFNYGRQLFPTSPFQLNGDWRTDFSAGLAVQMPIFNGGRTRADVRLAQQTLEQSRLQFAQLEEASELQLEQAQAERQRASAEITARQQTVAAAERVYTLTRLRYQQGLATQLEVSDARLALLQARVNLAQALTAFYAADAQIIGSGAAQGPAVAAPASSAANAASAATATQNTANPSTSRQPR